MLHFFWHRAQAAKHLRRIQSSILVGSEFTVPHGALVSTISLECLMHTQISPSLLAQAQSLYLSIFSQYQSTALQCLEPRGGGMRQIDDMKTQPTPIRQGTSATCNIICGTFGACIEAMRYEIYTPHKDKLT